MIKIILLIILPAFKAALTHRYNDSKTTSKKREGRLISATRNNSEITRINRTEINRKKKWEEKQFYGRFKLISSDISHKKTETWLRKGNLKGERENRHNWLGKVIMWELCKTLKSDHTNK